jgi:hypothetical protein
LRRREEKRMSWGEKRTKEKDVDVFERREREKKKMKRED